MDPAARPDPRRRRGRWRGDPRSAAFGPPTPSAGQAPAVGDGDASTGLGLAVLDAIDVAVPYGTWVSDADGAVVHLSASFLDLIDRSLDEAQSSGWMDRLPLEDVARVRAAWDRCLRVGGRWDQELRLIDRHGAWHQVLSRGAPLRDQRGRTTGWAGVHLDVTGRRRVLHDLQDARAAIDQVLAVDVEVEADATPAQVARRLCEDARSLFRADVVTLWRRQPGGTALLHQIPEPLGPNFTLDLTSAGHDDASPQYVQSPDAARTASERSAMRSRGLAAAMTLPIPTDGARDHSLGLSWFAAPTLASQTLVAAAQRYADRAGSVLAGALERDQRQSHALQVNDDITNALATARIALDLGDTDAAGRALDHGLEAARALMTELLPTRGAIQPGDLRRADDRP